MQQKTKMLTVVFLKIFTQLLLSVQFSICCELTVKTTYGLLRGTEFKSRNGKIVGAFHGVPFAKPPVGQHRFQDPQPPEPWTGVREAYNFGSVCVQIPFIYLPVSKTKLGNEDCLYLSVYTPEIKPKKPLPVLVLLHGGGFALGSGELDKTPEFFMDHDIVVVMPNYRLGLLGFLSTEDDVIPGNLGLKDQVMALVWVKNNIANFGGDPNQVTLIGESAGGASVHYHMLSPMSRGLFHRAISLSGTAVAPWAGIPPGVASGRAKKLAQFFNCSTESSRMILECLRTKNVFEMTKSISNFLVLKTDPNIFFPPVIDKNASNPFMPVNPHTTEAAPVPWIVGVVSMEGILRSAGFIINPETLKEFDDNFNTLAPISMYYGDTSDNPVELSKEIRKYYFGDQSLTLLFNNITDMFSDNMFLWPTIKALRKHNGPQYFYLFDYCGENSFQELFVGKNVSKGSTHTDDTIYIWKINNPAEIPTPRRSSDLNMSHMLIKLFVNFITLGNPTPSGSDFNWPLWDNLNQNFIIFENGGVFNSSKFLPERMQFWDSLNTRNKVVLTSF